MDASTAITTTPRLAQVRALLASCIRRGCTSNSETPTRSRAAGTSRQIARKGSRNRTRTAAIVDDTRLVSDEDHGHESRHRDPAGRAHGPAATYCQRMTTRPILALFAVASLAGWGSRCPEIAAAKRALV